MKPKEQSENFGAEENLGGAEENLRGAEDNLAAAEIWEEQRKISSSLQGV